MAASVWANSDLLNAFSLVDLLEFSGPNGAPAWDGPRHFDYEPARTEDLDGVWASAAANMRTYSLLRDRAAAFRADPEVQEALKNAKVPDLSTPTLRPGETVADLMASDTNFDPDVAGARGANCAAHPTDGRARPRRAMALVAGVDSSTQSVKVVP